MLLERAADHFERAWPEVEVSSVGGAEAVAGNGQGDIRSVIARLLAENPGRVGYLLAQDLVQAVCSPMQPEPRDEDWPKPIPLLLASKDRGVITDWHLSVEEGLASGILPSPSQLGIKP